MPEYKKNYGAKKPFQSRGAPRFGSNDGPKELFTTECSKCHKACEVPFRPNGKKPIFCRDCFKRDDDRSGGRDTRGGQSSYQKRDYPAPRSFDRPQAPVEDRRIDDLKRQVAALDAKLDSLIQILGSERISESVAPKEKKAAPAAKRVAKKAVVKKTAAKKKA